MSAAKAHILTPLAMTREVISEMLDQTAALEHGPDRSLSLLIGLLPGPWHQQSLDFLQDGTWKRDLRQPGPGSDRLLDAVEATERKPPPGIARLGGRILDIWPAPWSFAEHPQAAINTRVENALRHLLWRKTDNGIGPTPAYGVPRTRSIDPRDLPPEHPPAACLRRRRPHHASPASRSLTPSAPPDRPITGLGPWAG